MFLVNSRLGLFTAAPSRSRPRGSSTLPWRPFSRSYGANLPSSLTRDHPSPWVRLHPATGGGLRYGRPRPPPRDVSGGPGPAPLARGLPRASPTPHPPRRMGHALGPGICAPGGASPAPHRAATSSSAGGNGMSTVCPSPTPFGLGLGPTDPTGMNLRSEPSAIRGGRFARPSRYSCRHSRSSALHHPFPGGFAAHSTLPYHAFHLDGMHPRLRLRA